MRSTILLFALLCMATILSAQNVYTIKADSVKLTGCDSSELIIENHTQAVHGFLFNTNNGRTIFKRGAQKINDSMYLVGADTVRLGSNWLQGGNSFGSTGVLGTMDNNHLDLYTHDTARLRLTNTGNLLLGGTVDNSNKLQVNGSGSFSVLPLPNNNRLHLVLSSNGSSGSYDALIGSYIHDLILQTNNSNSGVRFQFGGNTDLSGSVVNLNFAGHGSGNISIAASSNYIDLFDVQNIQTDASPIYLSSGGYQGMDGVVVQRNSRDTARADPLFTVKEYDTVVMRVLKNGNLGVGVSAPSAQLHTSGTVRFAGLTSDTTKSRVIVSDSIGNLYYRNAATLNTVTKINDSTYLIGADTLKLPKPNYWSLSGNSGAVDGVSFIGTTTNVPLYFKMNNINAGRIDSAHMSAAYGYQALSQNPGSFGFGSTAIGYSALKVNTSAQNTAVGAQALLANSTGIENTAMGYQALPANTTGSDNTAVGFSALPNSTTGSANIAIGFNSGAGLTTGSGNVFIGGVPASNTNNNIVIGDGLGHVRLTIDSLARVMFNTSFPLAKNTFSGSGNFSDTLTATTMGSTDSSNRVASTAWVKRQGFGIGGGAFNGILNSSLAVNGTISAQRLKLSQTGWPDYVFARNYDLPTLPYLERYIRQNGHLPGIPSAAEVEKKGVDVGDHQAALLKKIEELTLYTIQQDKKLDNQQQEIDGLKRAIEDLKKMIADQPLK